MQEIRKYAQMVWELRSRQNNKPDHDARVLAIQTTQDTDADAEGNELPRAKGVAQVRPRGRNPPRQRNRQRNQDGEKEKKSKQQYFHGQKREGNNHTKQGGKYNRKPHGPPKEEHLRSAMQDWIQTCLTEAIQKLDLSMQKGFPRGQIPNPRPHDKAGNPSSPVSESIS